MFVTEEDENILYLCYTERVHIPYCLWHLYNLYIIKWFIFNVYMDCCLFCVEQNTAEAVAVKGNLNPEISQNLSSFTPHQDFMDAVEY